MKLPGFLFFIFILLAQMGYAQPVAVPLTQNLSLQPASAAPASGLPVLTVYLPTQKNKIWCLPEEFITEEIDSLWQVECGASEIEVISSDSCIIFSTAMIINRYRDTLCFTVRTLDQKEIIFQLDIIVNPPYQLPFIDDFSDSAPYPDPYRWQDKDVYINNSFAKGPPSLGVATFDGIDHTGKPYDTGYGKSDYLTSNYIDLEGQFNAHIRFWYQARGLGFQNYPRERDSLLLEFKTPQGFWNTVWSVPGIGNNATEDFQSISLAIPPAYISDEFQFRFVNYSDNNGMLGFWHLDYILVTAQKMDRDGIQDVAFTRPAESILKPYRSMPYNQFKGNEKKYVRDSVIIELYNHFNSTQLADPSRLFISVKKGPVKQVLLNETLLEVPPTVSENQRNLATGRHKFRNKIKLKSSTLIPALEDLEYDAEENFQLLTEMNFDNAGEPSQLNSNNYTVFSAELGDHYAYDDGTAEVGIYIPSGTFFPTVLQKFTLEREDTLKAVRFHFPQIRPNVTNQRYNIVIYQGELNEDSKPIYTEAYDRAIFPSSYSDSLGGFTTFALKEEGEHIELVIPSGDFYVGWQQLSANTEFGVYVGYDRNSPEVSQDGNILFSNDGSTWQKYNTVPGALMIRPVFGREQPTSTPTVKPEFAQALTIYPNPTRHFITVEGKNLQLSSDRISIFASSGQEIHHGVLYEKMNVSHLPSGKYHVVIRNKTGKVTHVGSFIFIK